MILNRDNLLQLTGNGLDVFRHYLNTTIQLNRKFKNPFYDDTKASCSIYFDRYSGSFRFKDFGDSSYDGDCFALVGYIINTDCNDPKGFFEILQAINRDMCLGLEIERKLQENRVRPNRRSITSPHSNNHHNKSEWLNEEGAKKYEFTPQEFKQHELTFWSKYGITITTLRQFQVVSVLQFKSETKDGKPYTLNSSIAESIFGYKQSDFIKLYCPNSKCRFLYGGKIAKDYCFGLEQLPNKGDVLFITGGEKDVLTLVSHGFHAICFNSETAHIPHSLIEALSYRFVHIVLLYDVDKTGLEQSAKQMKELEEFHVKRLVLPLKGTKNDKDISDFFKSGRSKGDLTQIFITYLNQIHSKRMATLKSFELDMENPPESSKSIVTIDGVPIGSEGSLMCITGGVGTGKSNYVGSLIAGAIQEHSSDIDTLGVSVVPNEDRRAVLLYDTEQSGSQLFKNVGNILKRGRTEKKPQHFMAYYLSTMSRKERLNNIMTSMDKAFFEFGGIHLVVIDGLADLIKGVNDENESVAIIENRYRLAAIYHTCIVGVLHYTPNGLKLRGHLGSEVQRKAAAILSIDKDRDPRLSVVKAIKVRDGSPLDVPMVQFAWNDTIGMHSYIGVKSYCSSVIYRYPFSHI